MTGAAPRRTCDSSTDSHAPEGTGGGVTRRGRRFVARPTTEITMARRPNYAFERNSRAKAKAEKREAKRQAKLAARASARQGTTGATDDDSAGEGLAEQSRDGRPDGA